MEERLNQFKEDLEGITHMGMTRFERADEVTVSASHVIRDRGPEAVARVLEIITEWWGKHYPSGDDYTGKANHNTWLAILDSVWEFTGMGS